METSAQLTEMIRTQPVNMWLETLNGLDLPDYMTSFAGIVCSVLTFTFEDEQVDSMIDTLATLFDIPEDIYNFMVNTYLPEVTLCFVEGTL